MIYIPCTVHLCQEQNVQGKTLCWQSCVHCSHLSLAWKYILFYEETAQTILHIADSRHHTTNTQRTASTPCSLQVMLYSLKSSLCHINTACLSLPILALLDILLLHTPFLLPVETRPSAQTWHTNSSLEKNDTTMEAERIQLFQHVFYTFRTLSVSVRVSGRDG